MAKVLAVAAALLSFLLVAPVIESGLESPVSMFQAIGNAADGGGGGF